MRSSSAAKDSHLRRPPAPHAGLRRWLALLCGILGVLALNAWLVTRTFDGDLDDWFQHLQGRTAPTGDGIFTAFIRPSGEDRHDTPRPALLAQQSPQTP